MGTQARNSSRNLEAGLLASIQGTQGTLFIDKISIAETMEDVAYWLAHRRIILDSFMST